MGGNGKSNSTRKHKPQNQVQEVPAGGEVASNKATDVLPEQREGPPRVPDAETEQCEKADVASSLPEEGEREGEAPQRKRRSRPRPNKAKRAAMRAAREAEAQAQQRQDVEEGGGKDRPSVSAEGGDSTVSTSPHSAVPCVLESNQRPRTEETGRNEDGDRECSAPTAPSSTTAPAPRSRILGGTAAGSSSGFVVEHGDHRSGFRWEGVGQQDEEEDEEDSWITPQNLGEHLHGIPFSFSFFFVAPVGLFFPAVLIANGWGGTLVSARPTRLLL